MLSDLAKRRGQGTISAAVPFEARDR